MRTLGPAALFSSILENQYKPLTQRVAQRARRFLMESIYSCDHLRPGVAFVSMNYFLWHKSKKKSEKAGGAAGPENTRDAEVRIIGALFAYRRLHYHGDRLCGQ